MCNYIAYNRFHKLHLLHLSLSSTTLPSDLFHWSHVILPKCQSVLKENSGANVSSLQVNARTKLVALI